VDGWHTDLVRQAADGELLHAINDYAVPLRKPVTRASP
jgi:hypothetical protein